MGIKRNDNVPVQMPPDFMLALPSRDVLCFHKQDCVNRVVNYRVRVKSHKSDNTTALLCIIFTFFFFVFINVSHAFLQDVCFQLCFDLSKDL